MAQRCFVHACKITRSPYIRESQTCIFDLETQIVPLSLSRQTEFVIITGWTLPSCSRDVVGNFQSNWISIALNRTKSNSIQALSLIDFSNRTKSNSHKEMVQSNSIKLWISEFFYVCKTSDHKHYLKLLWRIKFSLTGVLYTGNNRRLDYQLLCSSSNTPLGGM